MPQKIFIKITIVAIWLTFVSLQLHMVSLFLGEEIYLIGIFTNYFFHISSLPNSFRERFLMLQNELANYGFITVDPSKLYEEKYMSIEIKASGESQMVISKKEQHPNYLANKMFAEALYNEITSNPQWGFLH